MAGETGLFHKLCHIAVRKIDAWTRVTILSNQTIKINYSILFTLVYEGYKLYVTFSERDDSEKLSVSSVMLIKRITYET
jgi:hypothetical protein